MNGLLRFALCVGLSSLACDGSSSDARRYGDTTICAHDGRSGGDGPSEGDSSVGDPGDASGRGCWEVLEGFDNPRTENSVAAVGEHVFVFGGFASTTAAELSVERYDPVENVWETMGQMPAGVNHAPIAVVDDTVFFLGGFSEATFNAVATVRTYVPSTGQWGTRAPMPTARGSAAAAVVDGKVYVMGGQAGSQVLFTHEVYDVDADSWDTTRSPMPTPRHHHAAAAIGDDVYVVAGRVGGLGNIATLEIYDTVSDEWTAGPDAPTARSGVAAVSLDGKLYFFGGEGNATFDDNESYEPIAGQWVSLPPMPSARHGLGAAVLGGAIYVVGGGRQPGFFFGTDNERYTP